MSKSINKTYPFDKEKIKEFISISKYNKIIYRNLIKDPIIPKNHIL